VRRHRHLARNYTLGSWSETNADGVPGVIISTDVEIEMTRLIFAAVATVAALTCGPKSARAYEAPWCAVIAVNTGSVYWDCQYRSFEDCRPTVLAGNRGWCNPNPYFVAGNTEPKRSKKHRARQQ